MLVQDATTNFILAAGMEWDGKETDTHHVPGIQPADVEELLDHGSKVIVLSRGMQLALEIAARLANYSASAVCPITLRKPRPPWNFTIAW